MPRFVTPASYVVGFYLAFLSSSSALSQSLTPPAPFKINIKVMNSVNVVTGTLSVDTDDISVGSRDNGGIITLRRTISFGGGTSVWSIFGSGHSSSLHNYLREGPPLYLNGFSNATYQSSVELVVEGQRFLFGTIGSAGGPSFVDVYGMGARLELVNQSASDFVWKFTKRDGTIVTFIPSVNYYADYIDTNNSGYRSIWAAYIDHPMGDRLTFVYESARSRNGVSTASRLKSVSSSIGFGLKFSYFNPATGGTLDSKKLLISRIDAVSANCDISLLSCQTATTHSVSYSYTAIPNAVWCGQYSEGCTQAYYMSAFNDASGVQHRYYYQSKFYTANNSIPDVEVAATSYTVYSPDAQNGREIGPLVGSIKDANLNTTYFGYEDSDSTPNSKTTSITDANGSVWKYHSTYQPWLSAPVVNEPLADRVTDPNGRITLYTYDSKARLISVQNSEGIVTSQTLDERGNATEIRIKAKPGTGLSDIVTSRAFPACSSNNLKICNKPSYIVDARGGRTDYAWDAAHGSLVTETGPPDASGNRPSTSFGYTAFTGYDGALFYRQTSKTTKIDGSHDASVTSTYNPLNHWALKESVTTDGSTSYRECKQYDVQGNLTSNTSAKAGLAVCP